MRIGMDETEYSRFFRQPHGKRGYIWRGVHQVASHARPKDKRNVWVVRCPAPMCFYNVTVKSQGEAEVRLNTHQCPWYGGGTTTVSWGVMSDHFLLPMWKMLDEIMDCIKSPEYLDDKARLGHEARGIAKALAILMPPFFTTADEIAREAVRRWEARQKGEDYETPGIGRLKFKQPPGADLITPSGLPSIQEYDPSAPKHRLPEEAVKKILAAHGAGFTPEMLAPAYSVSVAVIKGIIKDGR